MLRPLTLLCVLLQGCLLEVPEAPEALLALDAGPALAPADAGPTGPKPVESDDPSPAAAACARACASRQPGAADGAERLHQAGPPGVPECRDGVDNDGDGQVDFPGDLNCAHADDPHEQALEGGCGFFEGFAHSEDGLWPPAAACHAHCVETQRWRPPFAQAALECLHNSYLCYETLDSCVARSVDPQALDMPIELHVTGLLEAGAPLPVGRRVAVIIAGAGGEAGEGALHWARITTPGELRLSTHGSLRFFSTQIRLWLDLDDDGLCHGWLDAVATVWLPAHTPPADHPFETGTLDLRVALEAEHFHPRDGDPAQPCRGLPMSP